MRIFMEATSSLKTGGVEPSASARSFAFDSHLGEPSRPSLVDAGYPGKEERVTRQDCLARAAEAESLANIVSLETDKARLRTMARGWREKAEAFEESRSFAPLPYRSRDN
jgi:hypothetical protein